MPDDEFEEEEEELPEPDLEGDEDDDEFASPSLDEDDLLGDDSEDLEVVGDVGDVGDVDIIEDEHVVVVVAAPEEEADEDDEGLDLEEELHPDDVEEPLDVLLLERTSSGLLDEDEYDEDEDDVDADDRAEPGSRIQPKRPGEFVCRSCFLVKHPSQLADAERVLCTDCV
jgi:hypothetical protein